MVGAPQKKQTLADMSRDGRMVFGDMLIAVDGGDLQLTFRVDDERGAFNVGFTFSGIRAYRFVAEPLASVWQIEDVYDCLAEIENSEWLDEIMDSGKLGNRADGLHHYMIYREDAGCIEVIAREWASLTEVPWIDGADTVPSRTRSGSE